MRVAYVCADAGVPVFGSKGASIHVQSVLQAFLRRGDTVELYATRLGGSAPADLAGVRVHEIRPERIDSVCPTGSRGSQFAVDERIASALVDGIRLCDLVYERHALWSSSAMRLARVRGVPGILEINAPLVAEQIAHRRLDDPPAARSFVRRALRAATLRVAVSMEVARRHVEYGFAPEDFLISPNGVDPVRFEGAEGDGRRRGSDDPFVIGFLGTLKAWHGLDVLVDAFVRLARRSLAPRLLVVGDGPMRAGIEARIRAEGLADRAEFAGAVDPAEVPRWLARMDVGTAPYAVRDGHYFSPLKVVEYQAAGLPVVASDAGQVGELVRDGVDGVLVEPGDVDALVGALERVRIDPMGSRRMGELGRTHVLQNRSWDAVLERILAALPAAGRRQGPIAQGPATAAEFARG